MLLEYNSKRLRSYGVNCAESSELLRPAGGKSRLSFVGMKKNDKKVSRSEGLTAFLLLGLSVLQDAQGQARVEAAELVGEQRQEASSEICRVEQEEEEEGLGQMVHIFARRSLKCHPLAFPEGRQPLALVGLFVRVQLLQHHTGVLSCQVILNTPAHANVSGIYKNVKMTNR